jgi:hypothetical protein
VDVTAFSNCPNVTLTNRVGSVTRLPRRVNSVCALVLVYIKDVVIWLSARGRMRARRGSLAPALLAGSSARWMSQLRPCSERTWHRPMPATPAGPA